MINRIKKKLRNKSIQAYHKYYPGICEMLDKRVNKKILVIESDDWGSIRVPSLSAKASLAAMGYAMDIRPFERCDTLENNKDLEELYNVLLKYKDSHGNHPVITANSLMCNPDFERIKASGFEEYFYEPTRVTYLSYPDSNRVEELVKEGIEKGCFYPQSHGREHFNFGKWMKQLQTGNPDALNAFSHRMCGIFPKNNPSQGNDVLVAFRYGSEKEKADVVSSVSEGLDLFEKQFGYKSRTFVAPCYWWSGAIEAVLFKKGVKMLQTDRVRSDCETGQIKYHYSGETNKNKQVYSVRNCMFEPSINRSENEAEKCLGQIRNAFEKRKAAVISSHRINYVGSIIQENRDLTLKQLDWLLAEVLKEFPDVEFMTSEMLLKELHSYV